MCEVEGCTRPAHAAFGQPRRHRCACCFAEFMEEQA